MDTMMFAYNLHFPQLSHDVMRLFAYGLPLQSSCNLYLISGWPLFFHFARHAVRMISGSKRVNGFTLGS